MFKIAISGKARSGKNTVSSLIIKHLLLKDGEYKMVAFADPMKQMIKTMFPEASDRCLYGDSEFRGEVISDKYVDANGNPLTHRQALLDIGKFGRQYNKNKWVYCLDFNLKTSNNIMAFIVTDTRFINEFDYLKEEGFKIIRVKRNIGTGIIDVSETEQDRLPDDVFDFVIDNNCSMEMLNEKVASIVLKIPA